MKRQAFPYVVPRSTSWTPGPWINLDTGAAVGDEIEGWDPAKTLRLSRTVSADLSQLRETARLEPNAPLLLVVEWHSSTTQITECCSRTQLRQSQDIEIVVDGRRTGGLLSLTTRICLGGDRHADPFTVSGLGQVLLQDEFRTALQGTSAQFPISVVDFAQQGWSEHGRWRLSVDQPLDSPAQGGVRLWLNSQDAALMRAVGANAADRDEADKQLLNFLHFDVTRQLVSFAVDHVDEINEHEELEESTAQALHHLCELLFQTDVAALAQRGAADRLALEYETQAAVVRVFGNQMGIA